MTIGNLHDYFSGRREELSQIGAELLPVCTHGFGVKLNMGRVRIILEIGGTLRKIVYRSPGVPESVTNLLDSKEDIFLSVLESLYYLKHLQPSLEEEFFAREQKTLAQ